MSASPRQMFSAALKSLVLIALLVFTVGLFSPGAIYAGGCEDKCAEAFGDCVECSGAWEGTNGEYSHCSGTSCYFVCASPCTIEPE